MAGLGFKDFQVGEVLTSADVDGYLMQQSVMRFADSAARGSALGTAVGTGVPLAEGMVAYLDDADSVQVFDGTVWKTVAAIRQIVYATTSTTTTTTSTSYQDTALSLTITPTSADSDIIVLSFNENFQQSSTAAATQMALFRDAVELDSRARQYTGSGGQNAPAPMGCIDSPATTSSITYKTAIRADGSSITVSVLGKQTLIAIEVNV